MTSFAIRSLAGILLLLCLGEPLADMRGLCAAGPGFCRIGMQGIGAGETSSVIGGIAKRAREDPVADFLTALSDPALLELLDEQVVPDELVAALREGLRHLARGAFGESADGGTARTDGNPGGNKGAAGANV